jgi:hypothetical protein
VTPCAATASVSSALKIKSSAAIMSGRAPWWSGQPEPRVDRPVRDPELSAEEREERQSESDRRQPEEHDEAERGLRATERPEGGDHRVERPAKAHGLQCGADPQRCRRRGKDRHRDEEPRRRIPTHVHVPMMGHGPCFERRHQPTPPE